MPASQDLSPENNVTDNRVELPDCILLASNYHKVALGQLHLPPIWYNMHNIAGQLHTAIFSYQLGQPHHHPASDSDDDSAKAAAEVAEVGYERSEEPWWWELDGKPVRLSCLQELYHGGLLTWPERLQRLGGASAGAILASGTGQHMPPGPIHAQV